MRLDDYFRRIGYGGERKPTLEVLSALQKGHVLSVPFENLDVQLGTPLTTDVAAAYEKIVGNGRGGWCYEQNGLFGWVLSQLGFEVTRLAATVMRRERGPEANANHLALLVGVPGIDDCKYIADVGFGGSLIDPIELREARHQQPPYALGLRRLDDGHWRFWEDDGDGEFSFDFIAGPGDESAMSATCRHLQTDPASGFVLNLVAQRRTPESHKTLRGRVFSVISPGGKTKRTVDSEGEFMDLLAGEFGLDVPAARGLWPKVLARHEAFLREQQGG